MNKYRIVENELGEFGVQRHSGHPAENWETLEFGMYERKWHGSLTYVRERVEIAKTEDRRNTIKRVVE